MHSHPCTCLSFPEYLPGTTSCVRWGWDRLAGVGCPKEKTACLTRKINLKWRQRGGAPGGMVGSSSSQRHVTLIRMSSKFVSHLFGRLLFPGGLELWPSFTEGPAGEGLSHKA